MTNLSDIKRGQIVGVRMAGASVTKTAELFGEERSYVSKEMTAFGKEGKSSSKKQNFGRKRKMLDSDSYTVCYERSQEYSSENYSRA